MKLHLLLLTLVVGCSTADPKTDADPQKKPTTSTTTPTTTTPTTTTTTPTTTTSTTTSTFEACVGPSDAHAVLDAFWKDFDVRYAVFDAHLPGGSWAAEGEAACAAIGDGSLTDDALFDVVMNLARTLDDGHVNLHASGLGRTEDAWVSVYANLSAMDLLELNVEANYLDGPFRWAADDWFAWGTIGGTTGIGYLSLTSLDELSPSGNEGADRQAAQAVIDQVLVDFADTQGMIIDVRANGGGWDLVGLDIAERFSGSETEAWSVTRRDGPAHDDFEDWKVTLVGASGHGAYAQPVVLLTSGATFSAAETFALAMRERDHVTVVGERTSGHFSDLIGGSLPNGWQYTYSGLRYRAADGVVYEAEGVPVDVEVAFDLVAAQSGQDVMLEAALDTF